MKANIPEIIPASIVSAKAGLTAISAKIVSPAGTDRYNEFVNDVPMINNSGIAMINPTDHLPNFALGIKFQGCLAILFSFHKRNFHHVLFTSYLMCFSLELRTPQFG
jgi:hypothetical protein